MKKYLAFLVLLLALFLTACEPNVPQEPKNLSDIRQELSIDDTVASVQLPTELDGATITWTSNLQGTLSNTYETIQQAIDVEVTLTALLSLDGKTMTKLFNVTIVKDPVLYSNALQAELLIAKNQLDLTLSDNLDVTESISLPSIINEVTITCESSNTMYLTNTGIVTQPEENEDNAEVQLVCTLSLLEETTTLTLDYTVIAKETTVIIDTTEEDLAEAKAELEILLTLQSILIEDIVLPTMIDDVEIDYLSANTDVLSDTGIVTRPTANEGDVLVELTCSLSLNGQSTELTVSFTILAQQATGVYTGYYAGADGLTGDALKLFLHELIDDHSVLTYSQLWNALSDSDEDPSDSTSVILLYSGVSMDEENHGGNSDEWNREHVWPRSHGGLEDYGGPAYTDMHHIRPTKVTVNSARGNLDFDIGGSLVSGTSDCYKDGDSFEPRDEVKGDVARMIFYMAVRYEGGSGELDLELNDLVNNSGPFMGKLSILIEWHLNDLPDEFELNRNDVIFSYQGNRNPFIDHPEFVQYIWGTQ